MGNIEIRQENNRSRRTGIFSDRKSLSATKNYDARSLTSNKQKTSIFSPIRYANKSPQYNQHVPLTERKANTSHINSSRLQQPLQFSQMKNNTKNSSKLNVNRSNMFNTKNRQSQQFNFQIQNRQNQYNQIEIKTQRVQKSEKNILLTGKNKSTNDFSGRIVTNRLSGNKFLQENQNIQTKRQKNRPFQNQNFEPQNCLQNREIIKKVRNFNDFLNQIKRKLKEDKQKNLQRNRSSYKYINKLPKRQKQIQQQQVTFSNDKPIPNSPFYSRQDNQSQIDNIKNKQYKQWQQKTVQKNKSTRKIQVALKLQNEKLQLQKYRKLVERQLSKTHSIDNISLCTKPSGQKILTIQYESLLNVGSDVINGRKSNNQIRIEESNLQNDQYDRETVKNKDQKISNKESIKSSKNSLIYDLNQQITSKHSKRKQSQVKPFLKIHLKQKDQQKTTRQRSNSKIKSDNIPTSRKQPSNSKNPQEEQFQKLKGQYQETLKNIMDLGKMIKQYQNSKRKSSQQQNKNKLSSKNKQIVSNENNQDKLQKIQILFKRLQNIQQKYQQTNQEIRTIIKSSLSSSKKESNKNLYQQGDYQDKQSEVLKHVNSELSLVDCQINQKQTFKRYKTDNQLELNDSNQTFQN